MARAVANPYLVAYQKVLDNAKLDTSPFGMFLGQLGLTINMASETRGDLTRKYGFAIPNKAALDFVASWGPIVEMGAGTGYWAHLLRKMKCDVIAYDNLEGHSPDAYGFTHTWTPIIKGNTARLRDHPDRTLLISWPDYKTMFGSNCLRYYKGKRVIYIGEGKGGCTGNDHFHNLLKEEWELVHRIRLPCWPGIHDDLEAYERKKKPRARKRSTKR